MGSEIHLEKIENYNCIVFSILNIYYKEEAIKGIYTRIKLYNMRCIIYAPIIKSVFCYPKVKS